MSFSETGSDVYWRTLFLLWMFSSTASALLPELQHEVIAINVNAEMAISLKMFFIMYLLFMWVLPGPEHFYTFIPIEEESISLVLCFPTDGDESLFRND